MNAAVADAQAIHKLRQAAADRLARILESDTQPEPQQHGRLLADMWDDLEHRLKVYLGDVRSGRV